MTLMTSRSATWLAFLLSGSLVFFLVLFDVEASKAGANAWTPMGLYGARVQRIAIDPKNPAVIWAGTNAGLFKSSDGGSTWESVVLSGMEGIEDVAVNLNNTHVVYVVGQQGVLKTTDGGTSWRRVNPKGSFAVAVSPLDSNVVLFGGAGPGIFGPPEGGIWRSTDGGNFWQQAGGDPPVDMVREIVFAPGAPHIVYAAGFGGVWMSLDNGLTWAPIHNGFVTPPMVYSLAVDPYNSQVVYIGTGHDGIYKTTNGGGSWTPIGTGLSTSHVAAITIDSGNQQVIYVGGGINPGSGNPGVYRSLDNSGLSWAPMMSGMGSRAIYDLASDNLTPQNVYAATEGGIWKYTVASGVEDYSISINNGALFTNKTSVTLTLTAPPGTTETIVSNDGGFQDAAWEPFATQKPWAITAYGAYVIPRVVYAKFKTNGQTSGLYQDDIILDTTAPTGTVEISTTVSSVAAAGSSHLSASFITLTQMTNTLYLPLVMKGARPGSTPVGLLLSATDDVSGVSDMLISNNVSFASAQWEPFVTRETWWVPEGTTTTVYVKFRDRAGNASGVYSDTVTR